MRAGSLERCAVGMAGLPGWGVIKKGAMTEGRREKGIEKKMLFYSTHLQLWTHYSCSLQALWNSTFQTICWEFWVSLQKQSLINITKGDEEQRDNRRGLRRPSPRHHAIAADGAVQAFIGALVQSAALQYSCLAQVKVWLVISLRQSQKVTRSFVMSL